LVLAERAVEDGYVGVKFASNWRSILNLDPHADIEVLAAIEDEITGQLNYLRNHDILLSWLEEWHSNTVQVSSRRLSEAEDPVREIERLASTHLSEPKAASSSKKKISDKKKIYDQMAAEFERAGVLTSLIRGIAVKDFTGSDHAFKFDFGYVFGNKLQMFHAVPLQSGVSEAIRVASRYKQVSPLMVKQKWNPLLTAVVEEDLDRQEERISYTLSAMERDGIRIATVGEMPNIAATAKQNLGL
jgi:hypothetical protein